MTILKEVSPEEESMKATFREMQKERMSEVIAIRQAIVELFNANPGEGFTNKQILEYLNSKGFNVSARQIAPKMNMQHNIFYEERKNGKAVWFRRVCEVCKKPLELGEKYSSVEEMQLNGHFVCLSWAFKLYEFYKQLSTDLHSQIDGLEQEKVGLLTERDNLLEEVKKLRSMLVFPSSENKEGARRIQLE